MGVFVFYIPLIDKVISGMNEVNRRISLVLLQP